MQKKQAKRPSFPNPNRPGIPSAAPPSRSSKQIVASTPTVALATAATAPVPSWVVDAKAIVLQQKPTLQGAYENVGSIWESDMQDLLAVLESEGDVDPDGFLSFACQIRESIMKTAVAKKMSVDWSTQHSFLEAIRQMMLQEQQLHHRHRTQDRPDNKEAEVRAESRAIGRAAYLEAVAAADAAGEVESSMTGDAPVEQPNVQAKPKAVEVPRKSEQQPIKTSQVHEPPGGRLRCEFRAEEEQLTRDELHELEYRNEDWVHWRTYCRDVSAPYYVEVDRLTLTSPYNRRLLGDWSPSTLVTIQQLDSMSGLQRS